MGSRNELLRSVLFVALATAIAIGATALLGAASRDTHHHVKRVLDGGK